MQNIWSGGGKSRFLVIFLFSSIILLIFFLSCNKNKGEPEVTATYERELSIGLIPEQNIFEQLDRYEPLVEYISRKTRIKLTLRILSQYGNIIDNFNALHLDGAFFGSFSYVLAHQKLGLEVLARPESREGSFSYHGLIFVRKGSGIEDVRDMRGKVIAFVDRATFAGYIFPLKFFKSRGVSDFSSFFREVYFTGTHEDAIYDVLEGRADIGAAKSSVFDRVSSEDPRVEKELAILARSPDVPETAFALRGTTDPSLKMKLREAFLGMDQDDEGKAVLRNFGAQRFVATCDADYERVFKYCREIGLDLSKYNFRNE